MKKAFSLLMNYVGRFLIIAKLGKNLTTTVSPLIHVAPSSRKTEASSGGGRWWSHARHDRAPFNKASTTTRSTTHQ